MFWGCFEDKRLYAKQNSQGKRKVFNFYITNFKIMKTPVKKISSLIQKRMYYTENTQEVKVG